MKNGFIKIAAAVPHIRVADPKFNETALAALTQRAYGCGVQLIVFPELSLCASTAGDLMLQRTLLDGCLASLEVYLNNTKDTDTVSVIGLPIALGNRIYNCAVVCHRGAVLGVVPKTVSDKKELRWFTSAEETDATSIKLLGNEVPFARDLLFVCSKCPDFKFAVAIGENLHTAIPLSSHLALIGATVVCNPFASPELVGRAEKRIQCAKVNSMYAADALISVGAGDGESTTDTVFGGHCIIAENGTILSEKVPFDTERDMIVTEIDVQALSDARRKLSTDAEQEADEVIYFDLDEKETVLTRSVDAHPFIPQSPDERAKRCETILAIQANGLKTRVERAWAKKLVLGISGGLDSTLALLVMVRAMDLLNRPRKDILAVTMPCFGTTKRTKSNATVLCEELGVDFRCVDIFDAVNVHFRDIGHDPDDRNVTYENSQARERTQILMDIANDCGGMVVGTGDLSELALGWATYNGDHMSMYGVNGNVPKTLIRHIVAHCADGYQKEGKQALADALYDILNTPVSPELLPADTDGNIAQKTEDLVGPYELHDFYLYQLLHNGFTPDKMFRLAKQAFAGTYDEETLKKWLNIFLRRFFNQQFKRSCLPDGPKVGSVGLSPRGDWVMPSDASSALWLEN